MHNHDDNAYDNNNHKNNTNDQIHKYTKRQDHPPKNMKRLQTFPWQGPSIAPLPTARRGARQPARRLAHLTGEPQRVSSKLDVDEGAWRAWLSGSFLWW